LSNGFQGIEDLKTNLAMILIVSTKAKTCEPIIGHVEADLENTPQLLPSTPNVGGFRVARTSVPRKGPKDIKCRRLYA
jgi:hypothetical protein